MFRSQIESIKQYFRQYKQKIKGEEVLIGTILFYVFFSLAFFMADHSNIECTANIINFYNSVIVFFSVVLYLIINNPICIVFACASFLASSLAETVLGTLYYSSRMFLSTYAHHILYSALIIFSIMSEYGVFSLAMVGGYIEFSAIFQSIKRIWHVKDKWFDIFNTAVFFIARIVMWIPALIIIYLLSETTGEKIGVGLLSTSTVLHIIWSWTQIKNLIRRYFSGKEPIEEDVSDLYLTEKSVRME